MTPVSLFANKVSSCYALQPALQLISHAFNKS